MAPIAPAPRTTMSVMARGGLAEVARGDDLKFVRQQPLLDEQDGIARRVESDGAVMARAALSGDVHGVIRAGTASRRIKVQVTLDFHLADFVFDGAVERMFAERRRSGSLASHLKSR